MFLFLQFQYEMKVKAFPEWESSYLLMPYLRKCLRFRKKICLKLVLGKVKGKGKRAKCLVSQLSYCMVRHAHTNCHKFYLITTWVCALTDSSLENKIYYK